MTRSNNRPPIGAIVQLDLPSGRYAYGRVLRDASLGIYSATSNAPDDPPPPDSGYRFTVGIREPDLRRLKVVGHALFSDPAGEWPPPYSVRDPITGQYEIYHRGKFTPVPAGLDAATLEPAAIWTMAQIVERIREIGNRGGTRR
jgi:hypothetical protein